MSDSDVKSYKQIKDDLDDLRLLVEKSELWVYKAVKQEDKKVGSKFDCSDTARFCCNFNGVNECLSSCLSTLIHETD